MGREKREGRAGAVQQAAEAVRDPVPVTAGGRWWWWWRERERIEEEKIKEEDYRFIMRGREVRDEIGPACPA